MKNFLLNYSSCLVGIIALICLYAILQIKFDISFWVGYSANSKAINEVIANLSYSYLAAYIFFLLTVTLPHWTMKTKVSKALQSKMRTIESNYKACVESPIQLPKGILPSISKEEAIENFKAVSYNQQCRMGGVQNTNTSIVWYIKLKHDENKRLATEVLEYKPWLSSETIAKIEEIRNSYLPSIIITLTDTIMKDQMDGDAGRKMLAEYVYDLWSLAKSIKC